MRNSINLFIQNKKYNLAIRRKLQIFRFLAIVLLFGVGAFSIILFLLIAASKLPSLKIQENALTFEIQRLHTKMAKYFIVTDQLKHINDALKTRPAYNDTLSKMEEDMPQTLSFSTLHIDEKTVLVTLASTSLDDFDFFLGKLEALTVRDRMFRKVLINSVSLNPQTGLYTLALSLTR